MQDEVSGCGGCLGMCGDTDYTLFIRVQTKFQQSFKPIQGIVCTC